jgi:hypothetical protein
VSISFDGTTKIATLSLGTTTLSVLDLYSRWVDWLLTSDNSKFPVMFSTVGGDVIDSAAGTSIPTYAFLQNGWRIKPQEANHTLNVTGGVLLVAGGGDPFINTTGSYIVRINYSQPVQAITVATGGSSGLTTQQETMLLEMYNLLGLDPTKPLVVTNTTRTAGTISQTIDTNASQTTVTRV